MNLYFGQHNCLLLLVYSVSISVRYLDVGLQRTDQTWFGTKFSKRGASLSLEHQSYDVLELKG